MPGRFRRSDKPEPVRMCCLRISGGAGPIPVALHALAVKLALLDSNPLASLPPLKSTRIEKGIFTAEEISKLLEKANPDWRGAILVGYFTGARLKDVCNLRWGNVDLEKRLITFRAGKTGQLITVAIHPELEEHLLSRNSSDDPQAFLFRSLAGKRP